MNAENPSILSLIKRMPFQQVSLLNILETHSHFSVNVFKSSINLAIIFFTSDSLKADNTQHMQNVNLYSGDIGIGPLV